MGCDLADDGECKVRDAAKIQEILSFVHLSERLKLELRHSWLSNGRQESVAEHSWHMALLAFLLHSHLDTAVNLERH